MDVQQDYQLESYAPSCPHALRRRLLSLGLTPGVRVTVLRRAPMKGPWAIKVRGSILALRQSECQQLQLKRCHEQA